MPRRITRFLTLLVGGVALFAARPTSQGPPGAPAGPPPAIDLSGYWTSPLHEDSMERGAGPEIADYGGFPLSESGRLFALSYDPSRLTLRHHQCDGYVMPYQIRALGNDRAWEERDPHTHALIALHWYSATFEGTRTIWLDGRDHPPAWAPHTWMGFSTGRFVGNALEVRTTHMKQGWFRRNGTPQSDQATATEFFVRHGDHLTHTVIINDPVFLTEPLVRTTDFYRQPVDPQSWLFPCDDGEQVLGRAPDEVPNYLFGQNPFVAEYTNRYKVSPVGHLGGAATMYPEIETQLRHAKLTDGTGVMKPSSQVVTSKAASPEPADGEVHTWPLRNNVYLLTGDGGNIVVQVGDEGALVVDTGTGTLAAKTIAAIRQLTSQPIQFIANTSYLPDRTGGNAALSKAGADMSVRGTFFSMQFRDAGTTATIIGHQNVQNRMIEANVPGAGIPSDTFLEERRRTFHNGDAIEMTWQPHAVTDGDSFVHFRRADVIVAGDVFTTTQYPVIDVAHGGSVEGEIRALNALLDRTVYQHSGEGGTIVVPGHGYVSDEHEVVEYRDMMAIVRDRVRAMIKGGATLAQVKAARPTADYDARYGAITGAWTTDMFVEAVFRSLSPPAAASRPDAATPALPSPLPGQQPRAAAPPAPDSPAIVRQIADLKKKVEPRWQDAVHFWCEAPRANRNDDPAVEPTKVLDNVYAIGNIGTVAHVIRTSAGLIMIDALNAGDVETQLLPGFARLGLNPADVKIILVAHGHADHFGGAAYFHDRYGSRVLVAAADPEPKVRDGDIKDGQPITLGDVTITPVAVPGHTPGSMGFIVPVTDRGERHTAALFGGAWLTPGFISNDGLRTFRASVEAYRRATSAAGVDVWMQNHPLMVPYADWLMKVRTRGPRDANPFIVGRAGYQSFVDVMAGCTDVNLERRGLR